ncbi:AAA family ATPase [Phenylobacterium immobile]|uniref:AAA family ATPase n=1 Tax=Phenylobacterium immobile TaxID=21 RepID=UPI000AA5725B|nr:ATP-binding protein [Phenylobacterium immobile]
MNAPFSHAQPQATARAAEIHFALYVYAAFLRLAPLAAQASGGLDEALVRWPFLDGYLGELAERGLEGVSLAQARALWAARIAEFEATAPSLPLCALAEAYGLDAEDLALLAAAAWTESEPRLGSVLEALHGVAGEGRFTTALLAQLDPHGDARLRTLLEAGLLETLQPQSPFGLRSVTLPETLAAALLGRGPSGAWRHRPADSLAGLEDLVLGKDLRLALEGAADLFAEGRLDLLTLRGPSHNGRRTLARAVAHRLGLGTLEAPLTGGAADADLAQTAALSSALQALRVFTAQPAVGEAVAAADAIWRRGPLIVILPPHGGVDAPGDLRRLDLVHPLPDRPARARLWARGLGERTTLDPADLAARWRMSSGAIDRAARSAEVNAAAARRETITLDDLAVARRMLGRETLDALATPVLVSPGWSQLVAAEATRGELATLEARCRHRETLAAMSGNPAAGVRALFKGVSGTGKTLAAGALASALGMDLYRVDLATVTSKYVGETEKNLDKVLSAAETLDVVLLLDEGDSLLGARTATQSANDRFANLETNFLLQRLESFQAVLIVTTNAPENIDTAFQRRMDVTVEFTPPGPEERARIWRLHLPSGHGASEAWIDEVAGRCAMTGGQIRNAALHAALLSLDARQPLAEAEITAAVEREYRKAGQVCPLRRAALARAR